MNNSMRELLALNVHFRDRPFLTGPVASYLRSNEYRLAVAEIARNPAEMARLTACMLKHIPLDPLAGKSVEDFVNPFKIESNEYYFYLPLDRRVNFIGSFSVPRDSVEARQVIKAIEENLASKLFKAASLHRRLDQVRLRKERRLSVKADAAYNRVKDEGRRNMVPYLSQLTPEQVAAARAQREAVQAAADKAFDAVYQEPYARMCKRIRAVADAALDPAFRGTGTETITAFAALYLCPQYHEGHAVLAA